MDTYNVQIQFYKKNHLSKLLKQLKHAPSHLKSKLYVQYLLNKTVFES